MEEIPQGLCAGSSREGLGRTHTGVKGTQEASGYILPLEPRLSQPQQPDHIATSPSLPGLPRCKSSSEDPAIGVSPLLGRLRDNPRATGQLTIETVLVQSVFLESVLILMGSCS